MPIKLTHEDLRAIFPRAPQDVINAFVARQHVLDKSKISHTRTRLAYFFANIEHECNGFTIRNLTENTNYTAERMADVWPNRFADADAVRVKYGTEPGWQLRAFDDIYGNRMGNRPGTRDGSTYIGRGGPQWTGRDGYAQVQKRTALPALNDPGVVSKPDKQPEVSASFWDWKRFNPHADAGNLRKVRKIWNGGYNGWADVQARLAGNDPYLKVLREIQYIVPVTKGMPGAPPPLTPEIIDEATKAERKARQGGAVVGGAGVAGEGAKQATEQPPFLTPLVTYTAI